MSALAPELIAASESIVGRAQAETHMKLDALGHKVDSLGNRIDSIEVKVDSLGNRIDSIEVKVDSLGNRVDSLTNRVESLEVKVDETRAELSSKMKGISEFLIQSERSHASLELRLSKVESENRENRIDNLKKSQGL